MENSSTNFSPEMLNKLNEVLKFALENKHSDFYRKKYGDSIKLPITSLEDFQKIPFLEKESLLNTKISDRTFVPDHEVSYFSFSSGTSKTPIPLITAKIEKFVDKDEEMHLKLGVTRAMIILQPNSTLFLRTIKAESSIKKIVGNAQNLSLTAKIMKELDVDGIMTTPTVLNLLLKELVCINFDLSKIKWISIGGEFLSSLNFNYLKSQFHKAYFQIRYGISEIGGRIHYRCEHLARNGKSNIFHIDNNLEFLEVINEAGEIAELGEFGEFVHTDMTIKPSPMIRYRTGDVGSIEKKPCPCGNNFILTIGGRKSLDFMKLHGGIIYAELISLSLEHVLDVIEPIFQMHVFEKIHENRPLPQLVLHLKLKKKHERENKNEILKEIVKEKISANLQISANATLDDFVAQGTYMPLEIEFITDWKNEGLKSRNIITHLN